MSVDIPKGALTQLKILFVIDSLGTGGAERYLAEKLPQLRGWGAVPIVVSLRRREEGVQVELQRQGFDVRILNVQGIPGRVLALRKIILTERPDVIQTVLFHADIAGRLAAVGTSAKVVSRLVCTDYDKARFKDPHFSNIKIMLARWIDGWTARHLTHRIVVNSNAVRNAAMRNLGIPEEKITVIKEGRDSLRLGQPSAQRRRLARRQLGLTEDQEVLINVGRQDYPKGQRYLLEAMAKLAPTRPQLLLLVVGRSGDVTDELVHLHGQLDLKNRVLFLGHREDVPDLLASADLFVFPSFYEGLPGAVIEAMALGLPIVASDIDPVRETVEEGQNAILVRTASPVELAAAIERVLVDRQMAQAFGRRSREIFEERFTLEKSHHRVVEFYRKVVSQD